MVVFYQGYVRIFDTTLRDGEQAPGIDLTVEQKQEVARRLALLGVDVIEAGFPASSRAEFIATKRINEELGESVEVTALSRCNRKDIDVTLDTGVSSIHLFLATSDIHLKHKLKMTREEVLTKIGECVSYTRSHGVRVEFSPEDSTRSELPFLKRAIETAVSAGAERINIPDTVGVMDPFRMYELVTNIRQVTGDKVVSVHCHNDFGMATANSIAGIRAGARQVHVTVNGIGERAGNTSLEEVVMATRKLLGMDTGVDTTRLYDTSRFVSQVTRVPVPFFKPVVGENAFGHEAGIHVHGVLENPYTYEPMTPEEVGNLRHIAFGKHSGLHGLRALFEEHGIRVTDSELKTILEEVKDKAEKGERVTPESVLAMASTIRK